MKRTYPILILVILLTGSMFAQTRPTTASEARYEMDRGMGDFLRGNFLNAVRHFENALANPSLLNPRDVAKIYAYIYQAFLSRQLKERNPQAPDMALDYLNKLRRHPENGPFLEKAESRKKELFGAFFNKGRTYWLDKNYQMALKYFLAAEEINNEDIGVKQSLARIYLLEGEKFFGSCTPGGEYNDGECRNARRNFSNGFEKSRQAVEIFFAKREEWDERTKKWVLVRFLPDFYKFMAFVHFRNQKLNEARSVFEEGLRLMPNNKQLLEFRDKLFGNQN